MCFKMVVSWSGSTNQSDNGARIVFQIDNGICVALLFMFDVGHVWNETDFNSTSKIQKVHKSRCFSLDFPVFSVAKCVFVANYNTIKSFFFCCFQLFQPLRASKCRLFAVISSCDVTYYEFVFLSLFAFALFLGRADCSVTLHCFDDDG